MYCKGPAVKLGLQAALAREPTAVSCNWNKTDPHSSVARPFLRPPPSSPPADAATAWRLPQCHQLLQYDGESTGILHDMIVVGLSLSVPEAF